MRSIEVVGERVKPRLKERLELVNPARDLFERPRPKLVNTLSSFAPFREQAGAFQHSEVLRNGGE